MPVNGGRTRPVLILFDVDGTLISASGIGRRALNLAATRLGLSGAPLRIDQVAGNTDRRILRALVASRGGGLSEERLMLRSYLNLMRLELWPRGSARVRTLAGVRRLLDQLAGERDVVLGLATGNLQRVAQLKLAAVGLWERFACGGFGSDHEERVDIVRCAIRRAQRRRPGIAASSTMVIGDTPRDVAAARAAGVHAVAVASGPYSRSILAAANPDLLLSSLRSRARLLRLIRRLSRGGSVP
jgi:phosphoglycolate phosphatase-like HAD superfamily hydrolase